ncbi:hypothetical protein TIFTF001_008717 [Ficus carica]|uniref:Uncharacterized protein n=1 Tax=Ficus carica TaxID=3494 RepID=A0AA87ZTI1_FICCA|nr:hypothetical protein TIFTF001_008717 [Ficus carica]
MEAADSRRRLEYVDRKRGERKGKELSKVLSYWDSSLSLSKFFVREKTEKKEQGRKGKGEFLIGVLNMCRR